MQAGHAVGLGDVPRVPRQRRAHAQGASTSCPTCRSARCSIWVLGFDDAKAGRLPTADEHAEIAACWTRRWMPAPAAGRRSACRRPGPAAVQRDFDGTPMPTDVMHDETCRELAQVLAGRNEGFMQMTLITGDVTPRPAHLEELAALSGPAGAVQRGAGLRRPAPGPSRALEWLERCRERGIRVVRPGPHDRCRLHLHVRGLEPVRRLRRPGARRPPARCEERLAKLGRSGAPPGACATSCRVTATARIDRRSCIVGPAARRRRSGSGDLTVAEVGADDGQASGRRDARHRGRRTICARCSSPPRRTARRPTCARSSHDPHVLFGVSDGGAHTKFLTAGRYPTETI